MSSLDCPPLSSCRVDDAVFGFGLGAASRDQGSPARPSTAAASRRADVQWIATAVESARGWLRLLAARQLPPRLQPKVAPSDLVQKTMLEAFLDASRFEGTTPEEVYGWLRRILRNNVHDCIRQFQDCRARDVRIERPLDELDDQDRTDRALIGHPIAERLAIRAEEDSAVCRALEMLPETYRIVVRLRIWDNLEWDEIGGRIGRSGDAARKIWGRSIVRLHAELT